MTIAVALTFICSFMPYAEAHILIIGDSNSDIPQSYTEAKSIANLLKSYGYDVVELYRGNATTKNILKGMFGADAIIYAGHGGYETGHYNMKGGSASPPFALIGSNDFIWGINDKMREGWNGKLFTAPIKPNIPVILLQSCFSTGWVEFNEVSNPTSTVYNFARMFNGAGANYYATAWNGAGLDMIKSFLKGAKTFSQVNKVNFEKIVKSKLYKNTVINRNTHGYSAFIGNWLGQFPTVSQTTKYDDAAAEAWYNSDRSKNPYQSDLIVSKLIVSSKGVTGYNFYISNTITNLNNAASSGFVVNYYLKKNSLSNNIYIGKSFIAQLNAFSSKNLINKMKVPINLKSGSYYILASADATKTAPETNESNNIMLSSNKIIIEHPYRDLGVTQMSAYLKGSKTLYIWNAVKNNGNIGVGDYYVNYYIKKKGTNTNQYIGRYHFPGLKAGYTRIDYIKIKLPKKIAASKYYVSTYVDPKHKVKESNEKNNYKTGIINNA
jgi:CARDB